SWGARSSHAGALSQTCRRFSAAAGSDDLRRFALGAKASAMQQATGNATEQDDALQIGSHRFRSRLIVGTGKYKDVAETEAALLASGAEIITVALRRIDLKDTAAGSMMSLVTSKRWT